MHCAGVASAARDPVGAECRWAWCLPCGSQSIIPYFYVIFFGVLLGGQPYEPWAYLLRSFPIWCTSDGSGAGPVGQFVNRHAPSHADLLVPPTSSHGAVEFVSGPDLVAMQGCVRAVHRDRRDGHACHQKYGKDWDRYCTIVKYRIVPLVY